MMAEESVVMSIGLYVRELIASRIYCNNLRA